MSEDSKIVKYPLEVANSSKKDLEENKNILKETLEKIDK